MLQVAGALQSEPNNKKDSHDRCVLRIVAILFYDEPRTNDRFFLLLIQLINNSTNITLVTSNKPPTNLCTVQRLTQRS